MISFPAKLQMVHTQMMHTVSKVLQVTLARVTLTSFSSTLCHQTKWSHPCTLVRADQETYRRVTTEMQISTADNPFPVFSSGLFGVW